MSLILLLIKNAWIGKRVSSINETHENCRWNGLALWSLLVLFKMKNGCHIDEDNNANGMVFNVCLRLIQSKIWLDRVKIARKGLPGWRASDGFDGRKNKLRWRREYLRWVEILIELCIVMLMWRKEVALDSVRLCSTFPLKKGKISSYWSVERGHFGPARVDLGWVTYDFHK